MIPQIGESSVLGIARSAFERFVIFMFLFEVLVVPFPRHEEKDEIIIFEKFISSFLHSFIANAAVLFVATSRASNPMSLVVSNRIEDQVTLKA
jgi:hypothetical protein